MCAKCRFTWPDYVRTQVPPLPTFGFAAEVKLAGVEVGTSVKAPAGGSSAAGDLAVLDGKPIGNAPLVSTIAAAVVASLQDSLKGLLPKRNTTTGTFSSGLQVARPLRAGAQDDESAEEDEGFEGDYDESDDSAEMTQPLAVSSRSRAAGPKPGAKKRGRPAKVPPPLRAR